jgi:hypothetical protein
LFAWTRTDSLAESGGRRDVSRHTVANFPIAAFARHFRARNHTKMSGVLRAAAPLARRLNAVPKGPVTQATRGMACAFPPARAKSL